MPETKSAAGRREDIRFLTGKGRYTDDMAFAGQAYAAIVRSDYAHAAIKAVEIDEALRSPGVLAVLTAADAAADGLAELTAIVDMERPDGAKAPVTPRQLLAGERVRYVGEPVVLVVAESLAAAQDAAEKVVIAFEPLPGVPTIAAALAENAPAIWDAAPDNIAFSWKRGDEAAVAAALAGAAHVTRASITISRVTAAPIEPRSAVAAVEEGRLVLRTTTQNPYQLRDALAGTVFKCDPSEVHVLAADVGGSFGMKSGVYREDVLVLWAARRLGRPVKWTSTRSDAFLGDEHARDMQCTAELGLSADGEFIALRARFDTNVGAYLTGKALPLLMNIGGIAGVYRTPDISAEIRGVFSNTAQTGAYRGAGRPEATYLIERLIDIAARELAIDPFELRRRNLIPADAMPYETGLVFTYDCGDFAAGMALAEARSERDGFAARQAEARRRGKVRGIGVANSIEVAGGPFGRPGKDVARLTAEADGAILLDCGVMSVGQGLETVMSDLAAEALGIAADRITYRQGDSDQLPAARGSGGSSATPVGALAVREAADRLIEQARARAADVLEAAVADIEYGAGELRVIGTDRIVTLAQLAATETPSAGGRPSDLEPLSGEASYQPQNVTFPNGCHVCEVEIDPQTGRVELVDYVAVEDIGRVLSPALAEGQLHGGIAQGAGQVLSEAIVYDADGGLLTGSFNDYAMPAAADFPPMRITTHEVPTKINALGVKGVGEAGNVGSLAATMNAVCDALAELGVRHFDMPATPQRVWSAIREAAKHR